MQRVKRYQRSLICNVLKGINAALYATC